MKVSVLITTFDRPKHLKASLKSLCQQDLKSLDYEIVVINDATEDNTKRIVMGYVESGINIKYLFTGQRNTNGLIPRPPGFALNIAIRQSLAEIIVISNCDVQHIGQTLLPIVEAVERNSLALATPKVIHGNEDILSSTKMPYLLGVRKEHLQSLGGYDEDLIGYGCEDSDLMGRLCKSGCIYVSTVAEVTHLNHGSRRQANENHRSALCFNSRLQEDRKNQLIRNTDHKWGTHPRESSVVASICIATFNKSELLDQTLKSIYKQSPPFEFEVIVVDDGSPPASGTKQVCAKYPVQYHLLYRSHDFRNPCIARNRAYRLAKGRVIIAQSDEVIHTKPDTIEKLVTNLLPGHFLLANVFMVKPDGSLGGEYVGIKRRPLPFFFLGSLFREDLFAIGGNDEEFEIGPAAEDVWFAKCLLHGQHLIPTFSQTIVGHHLHHESRSNPEIEKPSQNLLRDKIASAQSGNTDWCSSGGPWYFDGVITPKPNLKKINSIVACVGYDDFLAITLEKNHKHFDRTVVVTTWDDSKTQEVAAQYGCECFNTVEFGTHKGPTIFNKGAAMEAGFEILGRVGQICVWDADIILPENLSLDELQKDCLYTPIRRILKDPTQYKQYVEETSWKTLPSPTRSHEFSGYCQIFHGSVMPPPWYSTTSNHAGGCDSDFAARFSPGKRRRPSFEVLHLGPEGIPELSTRIGKDWSGRVSPRIDTGAIPPEASKRYTKIKQIAKGLK